MKYSFSNGVMSNFDILKDKIKPGIYHVTFEQVPQELATLLDTEQIVFEEVKHGKVQEMRHEQVQM